jgi:hypothetical protein
MRKNRLPHSLDISDFKCDMSEARHVDGALSILRCRRILENFQRRTVRRTSREEEVDSTDPRMVQGGQAIHPASTQVAYRRLGLAPEDIDIKPGKRSPIPGDEVCVRESDFHSC